MKGRALAALAAVLLGGCDRAKEAAPAAPATSVIPQASSSATPSAAVSAATPTAATAAPAAPPDPEQRYLEGADIVSITPVRAPNRRGTFDALLAAPEGRRGATIAIALLADPNAHRRPLAFAKLAQALGARVVPKAALRHVAGGDLAPAAGDAGDAIAIVKEARVLNDGTVDVLVSARGVAHAGSPWEAPAGRVIDPTDAREMATWERWSASGEPVAGEDEGLLRDFVEMIALDYLAANDARRSMVLTGKAIVLADNASAFPPHPEKPMLDRALRRLRAAERFPRGLREALAALDRERVAAIFAEGSFGTWLLTPRGRIELDERRAALLSLLEAKIAARGEAAVLCL